MAISALNLSLFPSTSTTSESTFTPIDLSSLYASNSYAPVVKTPVSKLTPWSTEAPKTPVAKLAATALNSSSLFSGGLGNGAGSAIKSKNDRELFLLHNAVDKLRALAEVAANSSITAADRERFNARIQKGLAEITKQANAVGLDGATLLAGRRFNSATSGSYGNSSTISFETKALVSGDENAVPEQFLGATSFNIKVTNSTTTQNLEIDLSQMGATARTVGNVASFINGKLAEIGVETRFQRVETTKPAPYKGGLETKEQKLKLISATGETIEFEAGSGATQNALYVAGAKTIDKFGQSTITRLDLGDINNPQTAFRSDISAVGGPANIRAMTQDAEGSVYIIADIGGQFGTSSPKSSSDVALQKLDSTGKVVWSRVLGSAAEAQGFSIAVSNDGTVAIAGAVEGKIDASSGFTGAGRDSFVSTFDAHGRDLMTFQQGASGSDEVKDIAFDANGNLLVLGKTNSLIGGADVAGGTDVYLQSIDATGVVRYTKTIGGADNDEPIGIKISGGDAFVAWNQNGSGRITRALADTGDSVAADVSTSGLGIEKINNFAIDETNNIFITGNNIAGAVSDRAIGFDFASQTISFTKDFAGENIRALNVKNGLVSMAFEGAKDDSASNPLVNQTLLKGFSAATGIEEFSQAVHGEATGNISIASVSGQSQTLQALGLPQGEIGMGETSSLTDLTGLRAGDYFTIAVNNGAQRKIAIAQGETVQTLVTKINRYVGLNGTASLLSKDGAKYLTIAPKGNAKIEVFAGAGTQDALKELGLDPGVIMTKPLATARNYKPVIALELPATSDLSDKTKAKATMDALDGVLRRIRLGYREISTDPVMVELRKQNATPAKSATNQAAIAAYNKQTALGEDALRRLGAL